MLKREDIIHYVTRKFLIEENWRLLAGEYPNGSDDELHSLRIMDKLLAKDNSPAHRYHSLNKLVPDLLAIKGNELLIIEMKPSYSKQDEIKLIDMLNKRKEEFLYYLEEFLIRYFPNIVGSIHDLKFTPVLGFSSSKNLERHKDFKYIIVQSLNKAEFY